MNPRLPIILPLIACLLLVGCNTPPEGPIVRGDKDSAYGVGGKAQLFPDMGDYTRPVTTASRRAQRYFDQGLKFIYGFNHDEAVRSFTKATELDPKCAMAWWGIAYAQGPNYNGSKMNAAREAAGWDAIQRALAELDNETPVEQTLIRASAKRYSKPFVADESMPEEEKKKAQAEANKAKGKRKANFASAMAEAWQRFPTHAEVGTIYADAMMVKNPWKLYKPDGTQAREETQTIIDTLEAVLETTPAHPGANHLYIHAVEASSDKARAIPAADRLSAAVPLSGHLVHMPSHLYVQVGMWDRAVDQNLLAIEADARYFKRAPAQYRMHGYIAHNGHMLAFAGMMSGREQDAMRGAMFAWQSIPKDLFDTMGKRYDRALCAKFDVMKRFGRWDRILAEPQPPRTLWRTTAVWRTCRAVAFAAKKDFKNAKIEHAEFKKLLAKKKKESFMQLNDKFIAAEIALHKEDWGTAIKRLEEALPLEDKARYSEPPLYLQPIRHTLGAVYFRAGRYADAERVYKEDLEKWPGNGWSLYGLAHSLNRQGNTAEADQAFAAHEAAWKNADKPLKTTCECIPKL
ncbi:MAG: tetratricopeptide repeat protein [Phycisphaeraceae bacterium]|nr:tetratricopeptide repeat protein [Phycisphaeraceae bacterium]